jgi:hypothetical protein
MRIFQAQTNSTGSGSRYSHKAGWLTVLLLAFIGSIHLTGKTGEPPTPGSEATPKESLKTKSPWDRIVMVGASATAGFTESEPLGGPKTPQYRLSRYLEAALRVAHKPVQNLANTMFFIQPEAAGRFQIDQALKASPTLVVGIDFLFWFCYGEGPAEKDRLQRFEKGLELLDTVQCPLVLGDIPDASGASNDMLPADQIPSRETMSAANRRLKQWAVARRQVVIVSLSGFMRAAMANQALTIHGHTEPAGKTRGLLQSDRLHPSQRGCAVLVLAILDAVQSTRPAHTSGEIRWNPEEVFERGFNAAQGPPPSEFILRHLSQAEFKRKPAQQQRQEYEPGPTCK